MPEQQEKTLLEILLTGILGFMLGAIFKAVGLSRYDRRGRCISSRQFTIEMFSAGAVGMLGAWVLDSLGIGRELSAVIIAMCGYVGGPLLDICYRELQKTLRAAFDGLQKWLTEGKWQK